MSEDADNVIELDAHRRSAAERTSQPARLRDALGRWVGSPPDELLDKLARGLHIAARVFDVADPRDVTEAHWRQALPSIQREVGSIGLANGIVQYLNKQLQGGRLAWPQWKEIALGDRGDPERVLVGLTKEAPRPVTLADGLLSLALLTSVLGRRPQSEHDWARGVSLFVEREKMSGRGDQTARQVLLDYGQYIRSVGSLDAGAEHLGLSDTHAALRPSSLPVPDAIAVFYSQKGWLPTRNELAAFQRERAFGVATTKHQSWPNWIASGVERIKDFDQLPPPPPYGDRTPTNGWRKTELPIELPPPVYRLYSHSDVLHAVDLCRRTWLPRSRFRSLTDRAWRDYCRGRSGTPSLAVTKEHGGLRKLLKELDLPGWEKRAATWVDTRPRMADRNRTATPREIAAREQARVRAWVQRPKPRAILGLIRDRGECSRDEISASLGWTSESTKKHLQALVRAGALRLTRPHGSTRQTYALAAEAPVLSTHDVDAREHPPRSPEGA